MSSSEGSESNYKTSDTGSDKSFVLSLSEEPSKGDASDLGLQATRQWYEVDVHKLLPAPPSFPFTGDKNKMMVMVKMYYNFSSIS